jgi:hypothetical protein
VGVLKASLMSASASDAEDFRLQTAAHMTYQEKEHTVRNQTHPQTQCIILKKTHVLPVQSQHVLAAI